MRYGSLIDTYETEGLRGISAWSMFTDDDLWVRLNAADLRCRSSHEHMVHHCVSEDWWFRTMLDIDVGAPPLPEQEGRLEFIRRYEEDKRKSETSRSTQSRCPRVAGKNNRAAPSRGTVKSARRTPCTRPLGSKHAGGAGQLRRSTAYHAQIPR
jgi:hypothetical protein